MTWLSRLSGAAQWIVAVGALTAALMLFTLEGAPPTAQPGLVGEVQRLVDEGRDIYDVRCATCHGAAGQGGQGPRLAGTVLVNYPDAADEIAIVVEGRGAMPPFGEMLSEEEIAAVVTFTRFGLS
jgi:mono/diheme cytochrome c family protein